MEFTGERMIPEHNDDQDIALEHYARYIFAAKYVKDKVVLDIASGSGYGVDIFMKSGAKACFGVDISEEAVEYSKNKYGAEGVDFKLGSVDKIPIEEGTADVVVSFETLEHVDGNVQEAFLRESKRVMKEDGMLIISTPNKKVFPKGNEFHVKELFLDEFLSLLNRFYENVELLYQDDIVVNYITPSSFERGNALDGFMTNSTNKVPKEESQFFIAICCDKKTEKIKTKELTLSNLKPWVAYKYYEGIIGGLKDASDKQAVVENMQKEISLMKSSKFWKSREIYLKVKKFIGLK